MLFVVVACLLCALLIFVFLKTGEWLYYSARFVLVCHVFVYFSFAVCLFCVCLGCELMQPQFISSPILTTSAVSDSTIDIHVSVTINTKSPGIGGNTRCAPPPPPLAAAATSVLSSSASSSSSSVLLPQLLPPVHPVLSSSPLPAILYPVPSLSGGACTLADLKKQRSLFRVSGGGVFDSVDSPHSNSTLRSVKSQNNAISNAFVFTPEAELNNVATTPPSGNGSNSNSSASNTWSSSTKRGKYKPIDGVIVVGSFAYDVNGRVWF